MLQLGKQTHRNTSEGKRPRDRSKSTLDSNIEKALTEISRGWIDQVVQDGVH